MDLTPERLAEIRDLCVDSTSANAPYNPDVWALERARLDLLAELDRRDKAANGEGMSGDRLAELRALLAEWKAPGFARELLAEVERLRELHRLDAERDEAP